MLHPSRSRGRPMFSAARGHSTGIRWRMAGGPASRGCLRAPEWRGVCRGRRTAPTRTSVAIRHAFASAWPPDPFGRPPGSPPPPPGAIRGAARGDEEDPRLVRPDRGRSHRVGTDRAVAEERRRLRGPRGTDPTAPGCRATTRSARGMSLDDHPEFHRRFGTTASGDARHRCGLCRATFSAGPPARRRERGDEDGVAPRMLVDGVPPSKIAAITEPSHDDIHAEIDFIHEQVRGFVARREDLARVDRRAVGSRFATDPQSLTLNWPTRRERTPVAVQHLATAHARSGFAMEASLQLDPAASVDEVEARMAASRPGASATRGGWGRRRSSRSISPSGGRRDRGRTRRTSTSPVCPTPGRRSRLDALRLAHAARSRGMLEAHDGSPTFVTFVLDGDDGLRSAVLATFAGAIRAERVEVAVVLFGEGLSNDKRRRAVAQGREILAERSGLTAARASGTRRQGPRRPPGHPGGPSGRRRGPTGAVPVAPSRQVRAEARGEPPDASRRARSEEDRAAHPPGCPALGRCRLPRGARADLRLAARPGSTPSGGDRARDRHHLHKPETMARLVEIRRSTHDRTGTAKAETPAIHRGLAEGRLHDRDLP